MKVSIRKNILNHRAVSVLFVAVFLILSSLTSVLGAGDVFKAYCHKDSGAREFTYHFNKAWDAHFDNNGTPLSGHELDKYTVEGDTDCDGQVDVTPTVTPTPIPTLTVTPTPLPTVTVTPTLTPTDVPSPTVTPTDVPNPTVTPTVAQVIEYDACTNVDGIQSSVPDGWFQNGPNSTECRQFQYGGAPTGGTSGGQVLGASTSSQGQVLGASTLGATGNSAYSYFYMLGLILLGISSYGAFATEKSKK